MPLNKLFNIRDFSGGLNTAFEEWQLDASEMPFIQNMVFDKKGSIKSFYGYRASGASVGSEILGLFPLYLSSQSYLVRMYGSAVEYTTDPLAASVSWTNIETFNGISLVASGYRWLASGSGTNNYYLDLSGGGNPNIEQPDTLLENGVAMSSGTLGALTAGQWAYGDSDSLGYNTIYVRLTGSTDPDTKASGYLSARYNDSSRFDAVQYDDKLLVS